MKSVFKFLFAALVLIPPHQRSLAGTPRSVTVKISFVEALDPKDTTSSQRFQEEYEEAIKKGSALATEITAKCGYKFETAVAFYGASDPLQAKERAEQAVKESSWLIVGPRRSNHYLLLVKGANATPTVSLMASSNEVDELPPHHLSMAPLNRQMAEVAAQEASTRLKDNKNRTYMSIISSDCLSCKDFAKQFDFYAMKLGLKKIGEDSVVGEQPDLANIKASVQNKHPTFILVPNFSIVTSYLISNLWSLLPGSFFVGGDGWGTKTFGFVQYGRDLGSAKGFTVRGNPPVDVGLNKFSLGKKLLKKKQADASGSGTALSIFKVFDGLADILCRSKPKDALAFQNAFAKYGRKAFVNPWGVSIYDLEFGNIEYLKSIEAK